MGDMLVKAGYDFNIFIRFLRKCNNFETKMQYRFKIAYKPLK